MSQSTYQTCVDYTYRTKDNVLIKVKLIGNITSSSGLCVKMGSTWFPQEVYLYMNCPSFDIYVYMRKDFIRTGMIQEKITKYQCKMT